MFPIFMWVKEYKGLKNFEITFDNNYLINIKDGVLSIERNSDTINISNFYSNNNIEGVNLLIGKNGVGKTSILELLTLENYERYISYECIYFEEINRNTITDFCNLDYFIIYKNYNYGNEFEPDFIIERYSKKKLKNPNKFPQICAEKIGIVKFHFFDENDDKDFFFSNIKKLNSGIKYQSKEKIYTYLNIENKFNKENFENAKMIISIKKDIYSNSEYFNEIKDYLNDNKDIIYSELYDSLLLYKINENDDISNIILKNYCNKLFLREIYYCIEYNKKQKLEEDPINIIKIIKEKIKKKYSNLPKKYLEYFIKNSRKSFLRDFYQKIIDISENMAKLTKNKNIIKVIDNKEIELLKFYVKIDEYDEEIEKFLKFYDSFKILDYKVYKRLKENSGEYIEEIISIYVEGLSDGEKIKLQYFSTLYGVLEGEFKDKKYITLLFDELEAFLHPEWSRIFLYELITELEEKYPEKKFKLIFATHSPFLIADVLAKDCIYLEKQNGKIKAKTDSGKKTFGANIIDLFKNTMFLESTFGKFATEKIKWAVDKIDKESYTDIKNNTEVNYIIEEIGEKLISNKLKSMIEAKLENKDNTKEYYKSKIEEYKTKIREIEEKEREK